MSETARQPENPDWFRVALDLGPLVVFFLVNWKFGIFAATGAFMVAITLAVAISWAIHRKLPVMALVTAGFVLVFGTLTLMLQDETFIKMKPTFSNLLFAALLGAGLAFGQLFLKYAFGTAFKLSDAGWRVLTWRWMGFFCFLALTNEIVWRNFSTDFWVSFKVFAIMPLTLVFGMAQMPMLSKYPPEEEE